MRASADPQRAVPGRYGDIAPCCAVGYQAAALSVGQFTLMVPLGCGISRQIVDDAESDFVPIACKDRGMKAGCSAMAFCVCTRIHLWTRFALRLWLSATLAIEAPGWAHS